MCIVTVDEPSSGGVTGLGEKDTLTPSGVPDDVKSTGELNLLRDPTMIPTEPMVPFLRVMEGWGAFKEKSPMLSVIVFKRVIPPSVPLIVTVWLPTRAVPDAVKTTVAVETPPGGGVTESGTNKIVRPLRAEADRFTGALYPLMEEAVNVMDADEFRGTVNSLDDVDSENVGVRMVSDTVVFLLTEP